MLNLRKCRIGIVGLGYVGLPRAVEFGKQFDTVGFVPKWDSGWNGSTGSGVVIGFRVGSREGVDALYSELTENGSRGRQPPYDAFWGARYAIVEDPDGNAIGLMSPKDPARKFWPPEELPRSPH